MIKFSNLKRRLSDAPNGGRKSLLCVLFFTMMLCAPAVSHATDYYLIGDMNSWSLTNTDCKLATTASPNELSVTVSSVPASCSWKIHTDVSPSATWKSGDWYAPSTNGNTAATGKLNHSTSSGSNACKIDAVGTYTFTFNTSTCTYTVTKSTMGYNVDQPDGTYSGNAKVTITPTNRAVLVYTTDGSNPTSASTRITTPTTLTFRTQTTLRVGLLSGTSVTDITTHTYSATSVSLLLSQDSHTAEIPLIADLFRSQNDNVDADPGYVSHSTDAKRWQLGIKYDHKQVVAQGINLSSPFDWCFKVTENGIVSYYGPSTNETVFDGASLGSSRLFYGDQKLTSSSSPVYFKTAGGAKSYTFSYANDIYRCYTGGYQNKYSQSGYPSAQIWINQNAIAEVPAKTGTQQTEYDENSIPSFYLLGNMDKNGNTKNDDNAAWDITTAMKMSPIVYYNSDKTAVDSLVYQTVINKPTDGTGFRHVFFSFVRGTDLTIATDGTVTAFANGTTTGWNQLYRPEIHDNRDCNALEGTLYSPYYDISNTAGNEMQSVNPLLSTEQSNADFYILRFNATTSTYNIQFVNGKYIYGAGVSGGSWTPVVSNGSVTGAIKMDYMMDGGYYTKEVTMTPGGKFGFCDINSNVFSNSYMEDHDPASVSTAETGTVDYCNMASDKELGDVPYMNHVAMSTYVEGSDASSKALTFVLPTVGQYNTACTSGYKCTLRLYPGKYNSASDANNAHSGEWFYTYEIPVRLSSKDNTNYYTTYSSNYPLTFNTTENAPSVYTAKYQSATDGTASILMSAYHDASTYGDMPAKTGVVLKGKSATAKVRVDVSKLNALSYTPESNELTPVYLNTDKCRGISMTEGTPTGTDGAFLKGDAVSYRNYLMTFDGSGNLIFSRSKTGVSYTNRAYLHLSGTEIGVPLYSTYDTQALYNRTCGMAATENVATAKEYGFTIVFDDAPASTPTALGGVSVGGAEEDGAYYSLTGVRMARPSARGIYIHNGKKMIIK